MRYHIPREFAPYLGVSWNRKLGETADLAEADGEDTDVTSTWRRREGGFCSRALVRTLV